MLPTALHNKKVGEFSKMFKEVSSVTFTIIVNCIEQSTKKADGPLRVRLSGTAKSPLYRTRGSATNRYGGPFRNFPNLPLFQTLLMTFFYTQQRIRFFENPLKSLLIINIEHYKRRSITFRVLNRNIFLFFPQFYNNEL